MSAADVLLEIVKPLAEPAAEAILNLVLDALQGKPKSEIQARAEALAAVTTHKAVVSAAAAAKRRSIKK